MELTLRELNRTLLARQLLLGRTKLPVTRAVERVGPLQAQYVPSSYVALWSRLAGFSKAKLTRALARGSVVQSSAVRTTLHLTSRADYPHFAAAYLAPQLARAERLAPDLAELRAAVARAAEHGGDIRAAAGEALQTDDPWKIAFALRAFPWVRLYPAGTWGQPPGGSSAVWKGALPSTADGTLHAVRRYLAAFGPATRKDVEHFLKLPVAQLKPALAETRVVEIGNETYFDVPRGEYVSARTPAPPRFLHSFDSAFLAHDDKSRIVAREYRDVVYRKQNATMHPCFLVDGFVAGTWKIERARQKATLTLRPFAPLPRAHRRELVEEGERLVRWYEDDVASHTVSVAAPA